MDWHDEGVILSMRPHGESAAIVEALTLAHGRHLGVVRGGASRKMAPLLQPGTQARLSWRARLEDHIGSFTFEPARSRAEILQDPLALAALGALCALLRLALPERAPHPALYHASAALLDEMARAAALPAPPPPLPGWLALYARWEALLLGESGFGLDLGSCAVTGAQEELAYISPKSGRAVSRKGAGEWADRLLAFPALLAAPREWEKGEWEERGGRPAPALPDLLDALAVTGHFLARELGDHAGKSPALPEARARLIARLERLRCG